MIRSIFLTLAAFFVLPNLFGQLYINEVAPTNDSLLTDQFGEYPDWIELHNGGAAPVAVAGYYLSDDPALPQKWMFPAGLSVPANGFLLVFASDRDTLTGNYAHTNFRISAAGEPVLLTDPAGVLVDQVPMPALFPNHSYGRLTDGGPNWGVFALPTPEATNSGSVAYSGYCSDTVLFSLAPGFYTGSQTVSLSGPAEIRYTTDGSVPGAASMLYTTPIQVDTTQVIRAACFSPGTLTEQVYTRTYFIDESFTLPVFSLSTDPANFFDYNTGIYVTGPNADPAFPYFGANFWQDWERPLHAEYFDKTGVRQLDQDLGVKIFGNYTRGNAMKSLRLIARSQYGPDRMDYPFFEDRNIDSYKQVVLRNAGDDFHVAYMRDGLNREIAKDKGTFDGQAYQPCIVFLNGVYWGVHAIRERFHEYYVEAHHGLDKDSVVIIDYDGTQLTGSTPFDFPTFSSQLYNADMSVQSNYDLWKDSVDIGSLIDYFAHNIHFINWDWPTRNIRLWRSEDRKQPIRYIAYDQDDTFDQFNYGPAPSNQLNTTIGPTTGMHAVIFTSFLANPGFRDEFITRYADLMNTSFHPAQVVGVIDSVENLLLPEMARNFVRWPHLAVSNWQNHVQTLRNFALDRPPFARNHVESQFSLNGQVEVSLAVSPPGAGFIKMNTVFPDTFPWTGVYFDGVPVTMTAHPNAGYSFDHWQSQLLVTAPDTNRSLSLNVNLDDTFTAYFTGSPAALNLTISEINYHSADTLNAGDWVEIFNYSTVPLDISGWSLRDAEDYHVFTFPQGTVLADSQYLVVCEDLAAFDSIYPNVSNRIGELGFAFSNAGDELRLFNLQGNGYLSMAFEDGNGWPPEADGAGNTLELIDPLGDLSDPNNWFAGCVLGSPGGPFAGPCDTLSAVPPDLVFAEINYNSAPFLDASEWVELWNYGTTALDISGWLFQDSDTTNLYTFPAGTQLAAGARLVLSNDLGAFTAVFPGVSNVVGPFNFSLSNGGETIRLLDPAGLEQVVMSYSDQGAWPLSPDGQGFTLELLDETGDLSDGTNWFAGCFGGSPGVAYVTPCPTLIPIPDITVSEINYHPADTLDTGDWIELYNYGSIAAELSGWTLRNADNNNSFVFPSGTVLAPGERWVLAQNQALFNAVFPVVSNAGGDFVFDFGDEGDEIRLFDATGALYLSLTYLDQVPWPVEADGQGYTLELVSQTGNLSDAANWFAGCIGGSPGTAFAGPCDTTVSVPLPDLTISEINYHSWDSLDAGDWIELWNYGTDTADLSAWVMKDDDDTHIFTLPQGLLLAPGGRLVLSNDLGKFSTIHPQVAALTGPFSFGLRNSGDQIRLFTPAGDLFLEMTYSDQLPWPAEPDGQGYTLELLDETGDLSSESNWFVGCLGGSPGEAYTSPCQTTGADPLLLTSLRIFPNPCPGLFRVEIDGLSSPRLQIQVADVLGQTVYAEEGVLVGATLAHQIDLRGQPSGVYLLTVLAEGKQWTARIVVE